MKPIVELTIKLRFQPGRRVQKSQVKAALEPVRRFFTVQSTSWAITNSGGRTRATVRMKVERKEPPFTSWRPLLEAVGTRLGCRLGHLGVRSDAVGVSVVATMLWTTKGEVVLLVDPGASTPEELADLLAAVSELHQACGGAPLTFTEDGTHVRQGALVEAT